VPGKRVQGDCRIRSSIVLLQDYWFHISDTLSLTGTCHRQVIGGDEKKRIIGLLIDNLSGFLGILAEYCLEFPRSFDGPRSVVYGDSALQEKVWCSHLPCSRGSGDVRPLGISSTEFSVLPRGWSVRALAANSSGSCL